MRYSLVLVLFFASSLAIAGSDKWHGLSNGDNPHANGGCASKKDKMAKFHKFHGKDLKHGEKDQKVEAKVNSKEPKLEDFI